jgi:hypothetical protein
VLKMINMSAIYSREREMRGRRRCVNAVEFQSSATGGSREHDDLRSDARVNVDRSPKRRRITGAGRERFI